MNTQQVDQKTWLLQALLSGFDVVVDVHLTITGIALDSRQVKPGDLFIALPGSRVNGHQFITQAVERGAVAVLAEANSVLAETQHDYAIPVFLMQNLSTQVGSIISRYFHNPSEHIQVIGVTGTNGKTSTSHFIAQLFSALNISAGVMGTLGYGMLDALNASLNTTPSSLVIQSHLTELVQKRVAYLAMEASSHGVEQGRLVGCKFETMIFTNLSRDHLDFHGTMEAYAQSKAKLFAWPELKHAIINLDDDYAAFIKHSVAETTEQITYSLSNASADVYASQIQYLPHGIQCLLHTPWGSVLANIPLLGHFSLQNVLAAVAALGCHGQPVERIVDALSALKTVPGRMEYFGEENQPTVVVDYAHTPDALTHLLKAVRLHSRGKVVCVFGCGGDRDSGKRPLMAEAVAQCADECVVTSDNPRTEDPSAIINDIMPGFKHAQLQVHVEVDRAKAIQEAILAARPDDIVVVAGKGHEDYQEVNGQRYPYSDLVQVAKVLKEYAYD
ncbi:UDP-N-acetylmuramoyl-L-alanyl-D-glutamate--2,6-diaminopimelate ligase [Zooshikella ganghwensis]|uniref:UDP-N-acetylmuramoyl-L-alanyl-D-glutamate--2,6-diaminopimelate ligase n=1 Tax=Zooshikella ganghwensis TaxID=202772 RepID=A0A4P9VS07_9GAMM|nr:UDP-N-acetylmuramoyl-L-alanyl-D-glutamate--2,6-diaminopimelate ligase [Zooshikella ganghwensis]RDH45427.1 UDP-N-acetylmuramoyl-L-alanyl-D-glutamate--2,6-diaminopimelate ligase [Zooshikella ganghwensis]